MRIEKNGIHCNVNLPRPKDGHAGGLSQISGFLPSRGSFALQSGLSTRILPFANSMPPIKCPTCDRRLAIAAGLAGRSVRCPHCKNIFIADTTRGERGSVTTVGPSDAAVQSPPPPVGSDDQTIDRSTPVTPSGPKKSTQKLGRFEIVCLLGEGGFGQVFKAFDPQLERMVALKVPKFSGSNAPAVRRFITEAKAAARLRHPNIVPTFDAGKLNQHYYIASGFIEGQSLADRIDQAPIEIRQAAKWGAAIASAVHYAHQQGLIHRDIKPPNVMLDPQDEPQLLDFGLAKWIHEDSSMTVDGAIMGTPAYMSPEQASGDHANIGPHSDQYSVGVVLYELLTGLPPFTGTPHAVLNKVLHDSPPTIRSLKPSLPKDLDAICQRAMHRDPSRRYDSVSHLHDDLVAWSTGMPVSARTPSMVEKAVNWSRRNPGVATLSLLLLGTLVGGILLSTGLAYRSNQNAIRADRSAGDANRQAERAELETRRAIMAEGKAKIAQGQANEQAEVARRGTRRALDAERVAQEKTIVAQAEAQRASDAEQLARQQTELVEAANAEMAETLARNHFTLAVARWNANRPAEAIEYLQKVPLQNRQIEWHLSRRQFEGALITLDNHPGVETICLSPDGQRLISIGGAKMMSWDTANAKCLDEAEGPGFILISQAAFSPRGDRLLLGGGFGTGIGRLSMRMIDGGELIFNAKGLTGGIQSVAFSPDGQQFATGDEQGGIRRWSASDGKSLDRDSYHEMGVSKLSYSPDGKHLVSAGSNKTLQLWDADGRDQAKVLSGHEEPVTDVAFHPGGTMFVSCSHDHTLKAWDLATRSEERTYKGHADAVQCVAFCPSGRRMLSGSVNGIIKLWDVDTGKVLQTLKGHSFGINEIVVSPDGRRAYSVSNDHLIKVWSLQDGVQLTESTQPPKDKLTATSVDGRFKATAVAQSLTVQDTINKVELPSIGHRHPITCVAFNPAGTIIASGSWGTPHWMVQNGKRPSSKLHLTDVQSRKRLYSLAIDLEGIEGVQFSPDGQRLLSSHIDHSMTLWSVDDGKLLQRFEGHSYPIESMSFSPDGRRIISGQWWDGLVKIWNCQTGEELRSLEGFTPGEVRQIEVFFSREGQTIVAKVNGATQAWDGSPQNDQIDPETIMAKIIQPNPKWHEDQAKLAAVHNNWYAATFHCAWWLHDQPGSPNAQNALRSAYRRLIAEGGGPRPLLPPILRKVM